MSEQYKHLIIQKELLQNERRTKTSNIPGIKRDDLLAHGQSLTKDLSQAERIARQQTSSNPGEFIFKLRYAGYLDLKNLKKHGIEFVSDEGVHKCVAFTDESGLSQLKNHLQKLGLEDEKLTYKQLLEALEGIENWNKEDRMSWAIKQKGLPNSPKFYLDVELWPIEATYHPLRIKLYESFEQWLNKNNIIRHDRVNRDSLLMYRLEVNTAQTDLLFNHRDVRKIDLPPHTGVNYQQLNLDINQIPLNVPSPSFDSPKVCILDSGINTNHPLLKNAIGESISFIPGKEPFDEVGHGTAVAGIALYGDLEKCQASNIWEPTIWILNGKIMDLDPISGLSCFNLKTIETTLIEAIKYFAEEHGCRIFNISIGNENAPYDGTHISGMAYILDGLARKYDILILVSSGNFNGTENPPVPNKSWREEYPEYLISKESAIIDPAPALNVLTVGCLAKHNKTRTQQRYPGDIIELSPATENQPAPFTRHGPSINGAFKPDVVAPGGNLASPIRNEDAEWKKEHRGLGVLTLNHNFVGNTIFTEVSGSSFSTPLVAHYAAKFLKAYPNASANLIRAMLINHTVLPEECSNTFSGELIQQYKENQSTKNRDLIRDVVGYGKIQENLLYLSNQQGVVLMAEDSIENNSHEFYELPLPKDFLRSQRSTRILRVSLAYSPPVKTTRADYIATNISFKLVKGKSLGEIEKHFNLECKAEVKPRSEASATNRTITPTQRDKGTVQCSTWDLRQLKPDEKWFVVITRNDKEWGKVLCAELENYALVVTAIEQENQEARLYTQIQQRMQEQERVRINF